MEGTTPGRSLGASAVRWSPIRARHGNDRLISGTRRPQYLPGLMPARLVLGATAAALLTLALATPVLAHGDHDARPLARDLAAGHAPHLAVAGLPGRRQGDDPRTLIVMFDGEAGTPPAKDVDVAVNSTPMAVQPSTTTANGLETTEGVTEGDVLTVSVSDGTQAGRSIRCDVPPPPTSMLPMPELIYSAIFLTFATAWWMARRTARVWRRPVARATERPQRPERPERPPPKEGPEMTETTTAPKQGFIEKLNGPWHERALWVYLAIVIVHWVEHIFQAAQIWILGMPRPEALGALGLRVSLAGQVRGDALHLRGPDVRRPGPAATRLPRHRARRGGRRRWASRAGTCSSTRSCSSRRPSGQNLFGSPVPTSVLQQYVPRPGAPPALQLGRVRPDGHGDVAAHPSRTRRR